MKMRFATARWASLAACLLAAVPAAAQAPRWTPTAGTHGYRFDEIERVPGQPDTGYRMDYDILSDGKGGLTAIVRAAWKRAGQTLTPASVDESCRTALHAQPGELARVTLYPITPAAAETLGADFMAMCAPAELFFPMLDILNVALIQAAPSFGIDRLAKPGESHRFSGYKTRIDRLGVMIDAASPGGTIALAALAGGRATVDWTSDPMAITIVNRGAFNGQDLKLAGVENFTFRVELNVKDGTLLAARTTHDQLDVAMEMPGAAPIPMAITRDVSILPRE